VKTGFGHRTAGLWVAPVWGMLVRLDQGI